MTLVAVSTVPDLQHSSRELLPSGSSESSDVSQAEVKEAVELFKLLADETRLRILRILKRRGELNVQTLCQILEQTQPAVSHHLALLRASHLIELRRAGKHNYYRLMPPRFTDIAEALNEFMP